MEVVCAFVCSFEYQLCSEKSVKNDKKKLYVPMDTVYVC